MTSRLEPVQCLNTVNQNQASQQNQDYKSSADHRAEIISEIQRVQNQLNLLQMQLKKVDGEEVVSKTPHDFMV